MTTSIAVIVHDVEADGLPDMSDGALQGRVALLSGDVVVSGWPILRGPGERRWEADPDVTNGGCLSGMACGGIMFEDVTHWLEFPVPVEELTGG